MQSGEGAPEEPTPKLPKCCLGALYFSEHRYGAQKPPVCAGFAKRLKPTDDAAQLPTDSVPTGGDFKYVCVGYSAWDEEALKRAAASRNSQADAVQLPYCEGLEVVSAAAVNQRPELMGAGGPDLGGGSGGAEAGPSGEQQPGGADVRQRPGRTFVPGAGRLPEVPDAMDWDRFRERFLRISKRMVDKMGANATYMVTTTRRSWQQIIRELGGGDKDR